MVRKRLKLNQSRQRGAAVVELAFVLPLLLFLFVIAIDFSRVFYFSLTIANCARNGARWQCDSYVRAESPYSTLEEAALADAFNLNDPNNLPKVTSSTGTDSSGNEYVEVTVTYTFETFFGFPGVPSRKDVSRTVRMAVAPDNPRR